MGAANALVRHVEEWQPMQQLGLPARPSACSTGSQGKATAATGSLTARC